MSTVAPWVTTFTASADTMPRHLSFLSLLDRLFDTDRATELSRLVACCHIEGILLLQCMTNPFGNPIARAITEHALRLQCDRLHEPVVPPTRLRDDFTASHPCECLSFPRTLSELGQDLLFPCVRHAKQGVAHTRPHTGDAPALFPRQPSAISGASWVQTLWPLPTIFSSSPASWPHLVLSERSRRPPEPPVHAWCCRHCYGCQEHENRDATNDRRPQPKSLLVHHGISSTAVQWLNSMLVFLTSAGSSTPMIAAALSMPATSHHAATAHASHHPTMAHPSSSSVLAATLHVLMDRTFLFSLVRTQ